MMSSRHSFGVVWALSLAVLACDGEDGQPPPPPPVTFGSAAVGWTLQDLAGNPLNCSALSISNASVSLGPDRFDVPCGDEQLVRFPQLTPGIYGVTLRLDVAGRGQLLSQTDNIQVVASQEARLDMIVEIDIGTLNSGSLIFRWTVGGQPAAVNCGAVGAQTVHIATTPSSIAQFTVDEDCTAGQVLIENLVPGIYEVLAEMRDADGSRVGSVQAFTPRVREAEQTEISIAFFQSTGDPAAFHGTWTITSSAAAMACEDVTADVVRVSLRTAPAGGQGVDVASATVACDVGSVTIENLLTSPNSAPVRATFVLLSEFLGPLDTETSTAFYLVSGQTSTITADFDLQ